MSDLPDPMTPHAADPMQTLDVAAIDQVENRIDALSERVEAELDTWRDIVE